MYNTLRAYTRPRALAPRLLSRERGAEYARRAREARSELERLHTERARDRGGQPQIRRRGPPRAQCAHLSLSP